MKINILKSVCLAVVVSLLFAACTTDAKRNEAGDVEEAKDIDVVNLRDGDCFIDPSDFGSEEDVEVYELTVKPCDETHSSQVYHVYDVQSNEYPGTDVIFAEADEKCLDEFEKEIGSTYEESALDFTYMYPLENSWDLDKGKEVLCYVFMVDGSELNQDVLGSGL